MFFGIDVYSTLFYAMIDHGVNAFIFLIAVPVQAFAARLKNLILFTSLVYRFFFFSPWFTP